MGETETKAQPEGTVVTQTRKGYKLKDRLLRPASVFVAKSPAPQAKVAPAAA
jgi:molecular chaperone GrpE